MDKNKKDFDAAHTVYGDLYIEQCVEKTRETRLDRYLRYTTQKIDGSSHVLVQGFWVAANAAGSLLSLLKDRWHRC